MPHSGDTSGIPPPFIVDSVKKNSVRCIVSSSAAPEPQQAVTGPSNDVVPEERNSTGYEYEDTAGSNRREDAGELPKKNSFIENCTVPEQGSATGSSSDRHNDAVGAIASSGSSLGEITLSSPSGDDPREKCGSPPPPPTIMANYTSKFSEASIVPGCRPVVAPPPPPPTPLLPSSGAGLRPSSSSTPRKGIPRVPSGHICVPQEHVNFLDGLFFGGSRSDVSIHTEDGGVIAAHSVVLTAASPVFKALLEDTVSWPYRISIRGVPYDAAKVFIRFLYSSQYEAHEMEEFVVQLLVLGHAYCVPSLKRICTEELEVGLLTIENVVDMFQMARLCDAPRLHLLCYRMIVQNAFKEVARTEGWRVMCGSNPQLEQELVEAVIESSNKSQEKARKVEEQKSYEQLHDAMEALVHICRDGCRTIGPSDKAFEPSKQGSCNYPACKGLESLVRHFASCKMKVSGGCIHCKRMWQLLELHSQICEEVSCKVPLCGHFRRKMGRAHSDRYERCWRKVKKAVSVRSSTSAFSLAALLANLDNIA